MSESIQYSELPSTGVAILVQEELRMMLTVIKKLGHSWVAVTYKDGLVIDWRPATSSEILAAHK